MEKRKRITCIIHQEKKEEKDVRFWQNIFSEELIIHRTYRDNLKRTTKLRSIAAKIETDYVLIYLSPHILKLGEYALERILKVAEDTGAAMVYADYYQLKDGQRQLHPLIDYQEGSLRDEFDFGPLLLCRTDIFQSAVSEMTGNYQYAALYDLRLRISRKSAFIHLSEYLYTEEIEDIPTHTTGEKMFAYVDPKNREVQIEMEKVCTQHLKDAGAWLKPVFEKVKFSNQKFPVEATVVIPVRNREKTIEDAVRSVWMQKTDFPFNLIVVDNHSTDRTTAILDRLASEDARLIHVIPKRGDLGIGGCWNTAVMDERCGKFAIQLDSDDMYIDEHVLQRIVEAFYKQKCAMVVGTYKMVNFDLEEIPPGIIDHKEWTPRNGRNNALRINGLGAPRAFYAPVLREIKIPNTSYGEDYAVGLAISRRYQIGRIYEPLYLCRRWSDNSDASPDILKMNTYNLYKDRIRTIEYQARIKYNQSSEKKGEQT